MLLGAVMVVVGEGGLAGLDARDGRPDLLAAERLREKPMGGREALAVAGREGFGVCDVDEGLMIPSPLARAP
jgi:hypothetical protein